MNFFIFGGPGGPYIEPRVPGPFKLSSHLYQSTYKIWKQSENVSVEAAADTAA